MAERKGLNEKLKNIEKKSNELRFLVNSYEEVNETHQAKLIVRKSILIKDILSNLLYSFSLTPDESKDLDSPKEVKEFFRDFKRMIKVRHSSMFDDFINDFITSDDLIVNILKSFLNSPDYKTPTDLPGIRNHLAALYVYNRYLSVTAPLSVVSQMEFVMAELIFNAVNTLIELDKNSREKERILKGNREKRSAKDIKKQPVLESY